VSIGTIDADDVTLTATNDTPASSTGAITASNDVSVTDGKFTLASIDAGGTVYVTGDARVTVTSALAADDGVVVTSTMPTDLGTVDTTALNAGSATNDITADLGATANASVVVSTGSGNDTITLNDAEAIFQVQTGSNLDGVTVTSVGAGSVINTGSGNDTITSTETDVAYTISAGAGSDTITVSATDDAIVDGGDDSDTLKLASGASYDATSLSFTNIEVIDITAGDAQISAAQFANESSFTLVDEDDGGDEVLTIAASDGVDTTIDASTVVHDQDRLALLNIDGGDGNDTITGSAGVNVITTGTGTTNTVNGGDGADVITGGTGKDTLNGDADGDTITGAAGIDVINGGGGDDTIKVSGTAADQNDIIDGGAGTDTMQVTATTVFDDVNTNIKNIQNVTLDNGGIGVTLTGQTEAFTITGGTGADTIVSGSGADTIEGGAGADTITGAGGNDTIGLGDGDGDADTVVFSAAASNGVDTIDDFETTTDSLDVSGAGDLVGTISVDTAAAAGAIALSAAKALIVSDDTAADWADVLTIMNAAIDTTGDVTGDTIIVVNNGTDSRIYLYQDDENAAGIEEDELTLIGVIDGVADLAEGDIDPVG
jgi:Ca2+-binding RTX toxin-like protein